MPLEAATQRKTNRSVTYTRQEDHKMLSRSARAGHFRERHFRETDFTPMCTAITWPLALSRRGARTGQSTAAVAGPRGGGPQQFLRTKAAAANSPSISPGWPQRTKQGSCRGAARDVVNAKLNSAQHTTSAANHILSCTEERGQWSRGTSIPIPPCGVLGTLQRVPDGHGKQRELGWLVLAER